MRRFVAARIRQTVRCLESAQKAACQQPTAAATSHFRVLAATFVDRRYPTVYKVRVKAVNGNKVKVDFLASFHHAIIEDQVVDRCDVLDPKVGLRAHLAQDHRLVAVRTVSVVDIALLWVLSGLLVQACAGLPEDWPNKSSPFDNIEDSDLILGSFALAPPSNPFAHEEMIDRLAFICRTMRAGFGKDFDADDCWWKAATAQQLCPQYFWNELKACFSAHREAVRSRMLAFKENSDNIPQMLKDLIGQGGPRIIMKRGDKQQAQKIFFEAALPEASAMAIPLKVPAIGTVIGKGSIEIEWPVMSERSSAHC